jgi:hypothetical protein
VIAVRVVEPELPLTDVWSPVFVPERLATAEFASIAFVMAPFAIDVALPTLVTTPVKLAFVVTVPAVRDAAVPVNPVPAPENDEPVIVPVALRVPVIEVLSSNEIFDDPESITIFPVFNPPRVSVCLLVVESVPSPAMYVAILPELAEMEAVGVPVLTFRNANLADEVDIPPSKKS